MVTATASPIRIPVTARSPTSAFIVTALSGVKMRSAAVIKAVMSAAEYR
jgi:hypothetical protein